PRLRAILLSGHLVLSFLQPLTEFERSSLTHPSFAELLKLNRILTPLYRLAGNFAATREGAARLGFVTLDQMVNAIVSVTEDPAQGVRIVEVPAIRSRGDALVQQAVRVSNAS
ncbi:MAG: hypothetical protein ACR2IV_12280, partial [Bryobacteraceae bacterium]